jgi:hypothetical protein
LGIEDRKKYLNLCFQPSESLNTCALLSQHGNVEIAIAILFGDTFRHRSWKHELLFGHEAHQQVVSEGVVANQGGS